MRKKQIPSVIAPEHFQTEQCFVSLESPILARSLEAALVAVDFSVDTGHRRARKGGLRSAAMLREAQRDR